MICFTPAPRPKGLLPKTGPNRGGPPMRSGCAVACGWCGSASAYGYAASQRVRKRIEEAFGWIKSVAGLHQTKLRGRRSAASYTQLHRGTKSSNPSPSTGEPRRELICGTRPRTVRTNAVTPHAVSRRDSPWNAVVSVAQRLSVSRLATAARSVSRRTSRSLIFIFSALIWSNIGGVVVGIVAFSGFGHGRPAGFRFSIPAPPLGFT